MLSRPRNLTALPLATRLSRGEGIGLHATATAVLVAFFLYGAVASGHSLGPFLDPLVKDWLYNLLLFTTAGICLWRSWRLPEESAGWRALGAGMALWGFGNVYWTFWIKDLEEFPYPSIADGFWLASYLVFYLALMLLARHHVRRFYASTWLDGLIAMLTVAALATALILPPILADTQQTMAAAGTNLAYPLADMLLIAFAVGMLALTGWKPGRAWLLIAAGFATLAGADCLYLVRNATDTYVADTVMDALWPAGMVMLAFAAWQPSPRKQATPFGGRAMLVMPSVFTLASLGVLAYGNVAHITLPSLILAIASVVAAAVRTGLTFREVQALSDSRRQAITDDLTGLHNRRGFQEQFAEALKVARQENSQVALLIADLDGFKELNDTLGHYAGDAVLQQIGPRFMTALRDHDRLARLGGDEFALLLPGTGSFGAVTIVERLLTALERPFPALEMTLHVEASIGVATFPEHGTDAETLMQRADVAMYQAKAARTGFEIYDHERDHHSRIRLGLLGELRQAIQDEQLVVHYQPKASLREDEVAGVEALVRWQHVGRGLLLPAEFLPMAERTGLMKPLTLYVLDRALRDCRAWEGMGFVLDVAVNLSTTSLFDANLSDDVARLLSRHGVPPERLRVEITETVLMADPRRARQVLDRLSEMGVSITLDDFGMGHSSLSYLKQLPVDELKIDKSFVLGMQDDESDAMIVQSTAELARRLGLTVVAEGVETEDAYQRVSELGCDLAQGYYLSRPLPAMELESWLRSHRTGELVAGAGGSFCIRG